MTRTERTAEISTDRGFLLSIGAAVLLLAACLAVAPRAAASDIGIPIAADESESDTNTDTQSGSDKEEKPEERGDGKRKSYQGSTEPSY
jgi:hypothetical protein